MVYKNDEKDILELKSRYLIPEGTKESYKQDLEFVLQYREKLLEALSCFAQDGVERLEETGIKEIIDLASELDKYMKNSQPANVMRRVRFVNNIEEEVEMAGRYILSTNANNNKAKLLKTSYNVASFLTYIAGNSLLEDNLLDNLEETSAKWACESLKNNLKHDLNKYISDEGEVKYNDFFFVLAQCQEQARTLSEDYNEFYSEYCENCERECSYPTVCKITRTRDRKYDNVHAYEVLRDALINKMLDNSKTFDTQTERAINQLSNKKLANACEVLLRVPSLENLDYERKNICLNWGEAKNACFDETKIKTNLYKSLSLGKGIDYNNLDDVLIYILLNEVDFSATTGKSEHDKFIKREEELKSMLSKESAKGYVNRASYSDLVKRYQERELSSEIKGEEPKGE